jgi:hypothetical protein
MIHVMFACLRNRSRKFPLAIWLVTLGLCSLPASAQPVLSEGGLYKERSSPEVYLLSGGRKIWIPTPDALVAMGRAWSDVAVVQDGALSSYPTFRIPSSSATPGSLIFPPNRTSHFPLDGIPGATKMDSQGKEIQFSELYGWLRAVSPECNGNEGDGADWHYLLEVDTEWAKSKGIDLNRILRVGNAVAIGKPLPGFSPRRAVSLPLINIELNSWGWRSHYPPGNRKPVDWSFVMQDGCKPVTWPFDPLQPNALGRKISPMDWDVNVRGPYVRVAGSLVTDQPHEAQSHLFRYLSKFLGITRSHEDEWRGSVSDWNPGVSSESPDHFARWTEVHPPDLIELLDSREPRITTRAVVLNARTGVNACEEVDFTMNPEAARPFNYEIGYEELRGPETYFPHGQDANNGSWITVDPFSRDSIRIKAKVCGGFFGGSPGRFKAIYNVWWERRPYRDLWILGPREVAANKQYQLTARPLGGGDKFTYRWQKDGVVVATTAQIDAVAGPAGSAQSWTVEVTDVLEGKTLSQSIAVRSVLPSTPRPGCPGGGRCCEESDDGLRCTRCVHGGQSCT